MSRTISNSDDIIDSRDVIARIDELEDEIKVCTECGAAMFTTDAGVNHHGDDEDSIDHDADADHVALLDEDAAHELNVLQALAEQASGYSDWNHGATLIRDSYFEDYARETAEDIHGNELREAQWPFDCIDWERAAEALQMDYTSVDFDGVTYWIR